VSAQLPTRLIAAKMLVIGALAVAVMEIAVVARADIAIAGAIHSLTTEWLTSLWMAVSDLAAPKAILLMTLAMSGLLVVGRHWHGAAALVLSVLAAQVAVELAKELISRPRPGGADAIVDPSGFSFPSAHSASAVALYLMLAVIAAGLLKPRLRILAYIAAALVVALVGFSRVYLGAHYPTDVLAGWLLGGVIVIAAWRLCSPLPAPARA
jgi:undecaprenyl-diphosphatase